MKIVSRSDARFLFRSSLLTIVSVSGAVYFCMYDFAVLTASVLLSSINYWRRPVYGWRRNADIATTVLVTSYNTWYSFDLTGAYFAGYVFFATLAVMSFALSHLPGSVRLHSGVHIFGNAANTILYIGSS